MADQDLLKEADPFYNDAVHYWEKIPATIDGMLGGFGYISQTDIEGSKKFLKQIFQNDDAPGKSYALDCGAGIGRVTKNLLLRIFERVDMVEQNPAFLEQAQQFITSYKNKLGDLYPVGLQNFTPVPQKYDIIWCQWVMGHLKDEHFVEFLQRCKGGLKPQGLIIFKENVSASEVETDEKDSSVTRPLKLLRKLFLDAGFTIIKESQQTNFPKGLYSVRMFALKPNEEIIRVEEQINTENLS